MQEPDSYLKKIENLLAKNRQYKFEAYHFLMAALHDTVSRLPSARHVAGGELLEGIRRYAIEQYGPMARTVLNFWGIHETLDFGKIVFALVEAGVLRKQPEDSLEDFREVYSFDEAFQPCYESGDDEL